MQLSDLRSAISNEACKLICLASRVCQDKIDILCERLISKECFFKVINSGIKVISENGHECILCLIENVQNIKIIPKIIDEITSKNQIVRNKISQYLNKILEIYHISILDRYQNAFEIAMVNTISDANKDTRMIMRQCFKLYAQKFPAKIERLVIKFDISVQKALIDEGIINHDLSISKQYREGGTTQTESRSLGKTIQMSKNMGESRISKRTNDSIMNRGADESIDDLDARIPVKNKNKSIVSISNLNVSPNVNVTPAKKNPNMMKSNAGKMSQSKMVYDSQNEIPVISENSNFKMKISQNDYNDGNMMEVEENFVVSKNNKADYIAKVTCFFSREIIIYNIEKC